MAKVTHTALGTPYPKGVGPSKERQYNIDTYNKAARSKALEKKKKKLSESEKITKWGQRHGDFQMEKQL